MISLKTYYTLFLLLCSSRMPRCGRLSTLLLLLLFYYISHDHDDGDEPADWQGREHTTF